MTRLALIALLAFGLLTVLADAKAEPTPENCGTFESFYLRAEGPLTTCAFARRTAAKVRNVAYNNSGILERFSVRVRGHQMHCRHFLVERRELIVCKGRMRTVRFFYAF